VKVDLSHFQMIRPISGQPDHPVWTIVADRLGRM